MRDPGNNLHRTIKELLIRRFHDQPLESQLPSVRALAEELNVAFLTVNGVLKELAWEGYVKRVPRKGTFLASRERTVQKDMQTGTSQLRTVVFAYPNYFSYATWIRLHHAEEQAVRRRLALLEYKMNSGPPGNSYDGLRQLVETRGDVAAVIVIPIPGSVSRAEIALFDQLGVPVILLAPCDYVSLGQRVWSVTVDWYRAGYLKTQHLLNNGHQKLAFVQHEPIASDRQNLLLRGMRQAMREAGRKQRDLVVASAETRPWDDSREAAYELTRELLAESTITAAIYESFRGVQGGGRAARELDRRLDEDFTMVATGLGNNDEAFFDPPITTVDSRPEVELDVAFGCLLAPAQHTAKRLTVEPVLRIRSGSAATNPALTIVNQDDQQTAGAVS